MIRAKKSLGQNFLIDVNILEKITNSTNIEILCLNNHVLSILGGISLLDKDLKTIPLLPTSISKSPNYFFLKMTFFNFFYEDFVI